jgi:5-methylcytosine-specific restriction endonuclease McrA
MATNKETIPYTFLVKNKTTGLFYYGVNAKNNHNPSCLWKTYFTSMKNKKLSELFNLYGKDDFEIEIRKTFSDKELAKKHYNKVIRRMKITYRADFMNEPANPLADLKGKVIGRLTVLELAQMVPTKWRCLCECGNETIVYTASLTMKETLSCGCYRTELNNAKKRENHPSWNFNWSDEMRLSRYRSEDGYKEWRLLVYEKDKYVCQKCNAINVKLNAHHIEGYKHNKELRTDVNNGITLCESCHKKFHSIYGKLTSSEQLKEYL